MARRGRRHTSKDRDDAASVRRRAFHIGGRLRTLTFTLGVVLAPGLCIPAAGANKVAEPGITPIQAELMADLHARLLKVGATVYARVAVDWSSTDCALKTGAVLEARVVSVAAYTPAAKISEVDLAFIGAQCGTPTMGRFGLLLAAMAAPPRPSDLGILSDPMPVSTRGGDGMASRLWARCR